jgi:hypothetical protein
MRRRSQSHTFGDNLNAGARIIAELENAQPGARRDKPRQLETASYIDEWLTSPGLHSPEE